MEKMTSGERAAWIFGGAEMAALLSLRLGDPNRADCIGAWAEDREKLPELHAVFTKNADRQASALLDIVLQRHCGKLDPAS